MPDFASASCPLDFVSPQLYGTRFTTLHHSHKQAVCFLFSALAAPSDTRLVSLQQMVLFGQNPSQGTLLKASQFLAGALATVI